jgi:raffinose/stachyose/melibiose transport system permease protein
MKFNRFNGKTAFLFAFPTLAVFTIFVGYPVVQIFYRSFFIWDGLTKGTFTLFGNYKQAFLDENLYNSFINGLISAVLLTVIQMVIATTLALTLLDKKILGKRILSKSYFIPVVLSVSIICQLWQTIYDPSNGLINKIFEAIGISYRQEWMSSLGKSSIISIIIVLTWQYIGYQFVLIYTGAKSIPEHYYEAATIDGATKFLAHLHITIPLLAETYRVCLIFTITGGLNLFAQTQILTNGGPGTATYTMPLLMYVSSFKHGEFGYGSTVAVLIVIQSFIATFIVNRFVARERITF